MTRFRSHRCGELRKSHVGETVRLSGWVHRKRDHGGLLFIDLRDNDGLTQLVFDPDRAAAFGLAEKVRSEFVIMVEGAVVARTGETVNPNLPTGDIEVAVASMEVLSEAQDLPLPVFGEPDYPEDIRLTYRFLDLRRETLHANILLRSKIIADIRRRMTEAGFNEFQTPILTASSPEGARDFLVPSRMHPGKFYALPQAPQQFKQLIMVAGFDRYFQIAPCFRDEDARADRSPGEFYQLDVEMSFVEQDDVFSAIEPVLHGLFEKFANGRKVSPYPFERIPYADAMRKYGSDKPDLRNPIEMQNVTDHFRGSGFKVFAGLIEKDPKVEVWAIPAPGGGNRAFCDRMNSWAQGEGQPGLGYIFFRERDHSGGGDEDGGGSGAGYGGGAGVRDENGDLYPEMIFGAGPVAKNIGPDRTAAIRAQLDLKEGDAVFFVAGQPAKFTSFAGAARTRIGTELGLVEEGVFKFCWIVDFPMFEWNEDEKKIDFSHNPFSMPNYPLDRFLALGEGDADEILGITAFQYDIVCNGVELSSGAIRNHKPDVMYKAFGIAGYDKSVVETKFGGMLNAFKYGAPPHGGLAPGIDRMVMLLAGVENLREVTMFPMNQQAQDLLMQAPSEVEPKQLKELHIRVVPPLEKKGG
ncbi:MAG: aspartate--tRNA ligase [Alphaproteobacteria bacterium HGW-Alphaproteobacteria-11]|nr:MAG: aspartate--tRNA ligase [Alphaproteobacteria bacterium HGW-Alphaproteobacteria-11]